MQNACSLLHAQKYGTATTNTAGALGSTNASESNIIIDADAYDNDESQFIQQTNSDTYTHNYNSDINSNNHKNDSMYDYT